MLSRQFVRENPEVVREALDNKGVDVDLDRILDVDEEWRELKSRGDDLRHERNEVSSTIGELKQAGEEEAAQEAIERAHRRSSRSCRRSKSAPTSWRPNWRSPCSNSPDPHESVPVGADESENVERRREGFDDLREVPDNVEPHYDLGEELEILDFERGAKVAGAASTSRRATAPGWSMR